MAPGMPMSPSTACQPALVQSEKVPVGVPFVGDHVHPEDGREVGRRRCPGRRSAAGRRRSGARGGRRSRRSGTVERDGRLRRGQPQAGALRGERVLGAAADHPGHGRPLGDRDPDAGRERGGHLHRLDPGDGADARRHGVAVDREDALRARRRPSPPAAVPSSRVPVTADRADPEDRRPEDRGQHRHLDDQHQRRQQAAVVRRARRPARGPGAPPGGAAPSRAARSRRGTSKRRAIVGRSAIAVATARTRTRCRVARSWPSGRAAGPRSRPGAPGAGEGRVDQALAELGEGDAGGAGGVGKQGELGEAGDGVHLQHPGHGRRRRR